MTGAGGKNGAAGRKPAGIPTGRKLVVPLVLFCLVARPAAADEWKFDAVHLKNGQTFVGLLLEETSDHVVMKSVTRRTGRPTLVNPVRFQRREVVRIDRLERDERAELEKRLNALVREREFFMTQLRGLDPAAGPELVQDAVKLKSAEWFDGAGPAFAYESTYFRLLANTNDKVAQLAVIHLEQIYNAYIRAIPPRVKSGAVTTIVLPRDWADYQRVVLKLSNGRISNLATPAFYDVENNRIVCGSNLTELIDELEGIRTRHRELSRELEERLAQLRRVYKDRIPRSLGSQLVAAQQKIRSTEADNLRIFAEAQENLFRRLYHEAFHAYLANFVYPPGEGEVPRWLNEGLAQIFETAIVEVGELRANHASKERVHAIRGAIASDTLVPVSDLLRAGSDQFLALHDPKSQKMTDENREMLERHYLGSWALAYYLFTHGIVGSPAMDDYVRALHQGSDPVEAFSQLVGKPLAEFKKEYMVFLNKLQPQ